MSLIQEDVVKSLTAVVKHYSTFKKDFFQKYGDVDDCILTILLGEILEGIQLNRESLVGLISVRSDMYKTIAACKAKDPELLPVLYIHKSDQLFAAGIANSYFCIFDVDRNFALKHEVSV